MASIPLKKANRVLGVFDISFETAHSFTQDELRVLNLFADHAAIAIENAQLYADAQRANQAKSEFVDTVSNELKEPLTSIQGYARLMSLGAGGTLTRQQLDFTNVILRNVKRIADLVRDLLDLSRIESGRIKLSPRPIELSRTAHDAVRTMQAEAAEHQLIVNIPDELPYVKADPDRIIQVWVNLIDNALKYMPEKGQIRVWAQPHTSLETESRNGGWVVCAVQDTGMGIAPQDQERIFERFYHIRHPENTRRPGTGLGLSIAHSIIELHGGHMWVESVPGQGSTFYFTLPTT
jgi:signal transduction histidine kinase